MAALSMSFHNERTPREHQPGLAVSMANAVSSPLKNARTPEAIILVTAQLAKVEIAQLGRVVLTVSALMGLQKKIARVSAAPSRDMEQLATRVILAINRQVVAALMVNVRLERNNNAVTKEDRIRETTLRVPLIRARRLAVLLMELVPF